MTEEGGDSTGWVAAEEQGEGKNSLEVSITFENNFGTNPFPGVCVEKQQDGNPLLSTY